MGNSYGFHPEALADYTQAANHYLQEASPRVANGFVAAVESAVSTLVAAPTRWRVVETPGVRRYVLSRYPFVIYYRLEQQRRHVTIYAVMHTSRQPGYWHQRIDSKA